MFPCFGRTAIGRNAVGRLALWLGALFSLGFPSATRAQRFVEISAEIQYFDYVKQTNGGGVSRRPRGSFAAKCIVGTNEWQIQSGFMKDGRMDWYFDGTNVYRTFLVTNSSKGSTAPPSAQGLMGPATPEFFKSNLTVSIHPSPGGYPIDDLGVQVPWLAFGSGSYLKQQGRIVPLPTTITRISDDAFAYTDKTQSYKDEFGLPTSVWLYTSKEQYQRGLTDERAAKVGGAQRARLSAKPSPYPDGILKFRYDVSASTNFAGWHFPTEFAFTTYEADPQGQWSARLGGTGKLTAIRESPARPRNVLDPSRRQMVFDYRFRHPAKLVDGIIYQWSKPGVPAMNEPALQAEFSRLVEQAKDDPAAKIKPVRQ